MNPLKFKLVMDCLTRFKKVKPDLPDVFLASQAPIHQLTSIKTMEESYEEFIRTSTTTKSRWWYVVSG